MHLADIAGIGRTETKEHWDKGLIDLAIEAGGAAMDDAGCRPSAVVVANALGGALGDQRNLAAYIARDLGLKVADTFTVEADEASGGAALRIALALVGSGMHEQVLVIGAEKTTDALPEILEAARAAALDTRSEAAFGFSLSVASALAMSRYLEKYGLPRNAFYHLSAIAHAHAARNPAAFFPWPLTEEQYGSAPMVSDPVTVCDTAPPCDGAAAAVIRTKGAPGLNHKRVEIIGSSSITTAPGISAPCLDLDLKAARLSAAEALAQARMALDDVSLFELHDSSTIMAALSLEAVGLAEPGKAPEVARGNSLRIGGRHPTWTFGGLKARGNPAGAVGLYQVAEAALQLRGEAGGNQVPGARTALVQCLGSFGATAVTHILRAG